MEVQLTVPYYAKCIAEFRATHPGSDMQATTPRAPSQPVARALPAPSSRPHLPTDKCFSTMLTVMNLNFPNHLEIAR